MNTSARMRGQFCIIFINRNKKEDLTSAKSYFTEINLTSNTNDTWRILAHDDSVKCVPLNITFLCSNTMKLISCIYGHICMYIYMQNIFFKYICLQLVLVIFIPYFIFLIAYSHLQRIPTKILESSGYRTLFLKNPNNKILEYMWAYFYTYILWAL